MGIKKRQSGSANRVRGERWDGPALPIDTGDGVFSARYSDLGLAGLDFPGTHSRVGCGSVNLEGQTAEWHRLTAEALKMALKGRDPVEMPPVDLTCGTTFQRQVWATLRKLRAGEVVTYGKLAKMTGYPRAIRAVAAACGANPLPVLIPCHRIVAAGGGLGGFSGGLPWKRRLLARETKLVFA